MQQGINLRWETALRRRYRAWLAAIIAALGLVISYVGLRGGFTLEQLTVGVLAPIAPMLLWGIREFQKHGESADTSDRLRGKGMLLWAAGLERQLPEGELIVRSRQLQSEIYDWRVNSPIIFDRIYRWLRASGEEQMNVAASELVRDAKTHGF